MFNVYYGTEAGHSHSLCKSSSPLIPVISHLIFTTYIQTNLAGKQRKSHLHDDYRRGKFSEVPSHSFECESEETKIRKLANTPHSIR